MSAHIGVDLGGTKIAAGLISDDGTILSSQKIATPRDSAESVVQALVEVIRPLKVQVPDANICVAVPGFVAKDNAEVLITPNLPLRMFNLKVELSKHLSGDIRIENDANAAAWGEYLYGVARGFENVVVLTVGTGLGGGLILNSKLYRGSFGVAAELGHMTIAPDGLLCGCGMHGCWEQYASGNALVRTARELASVTPEAAAVLLSLGDGTIEGIQGPHISKAAMIGCDVALRAYQELGKWLGQGIASLTALLDPDLIVLGGGVAEAGAALLNPVRQSLDVHLSARNFRKAPEVLIAKLGNEAGIVGASALARG